MGAFWHASDREEEHGDEAGSRLNPHNKQPHKLPAENRRCSCLLISLHIYVISWSRNSILKKSRSDEVAAVDMAISATKTGSF